MITKGRITGISKSLTDNNYNITLSLECGDLFDLAKEEVSVEIKKYRKHRSKNANALMWECLDEIATYLHTDKWQVYLQMLRRYGQWDLVLMDPQGVDKMKAVWRECEEVGRITDEDGNEKVQLMCYYGSSTYDSKEFTKLLDGIISEMKEMGITVPSEREVNDVLKRYEEELRKREDAKEKANATTPSEEKPVTEQETKVTEVTEDTEGADGFVENKETEVSVKEPVAEDTFMNPPVDVPDEKEPEVKPEPIKKKKVKFHINFD